MKKNAVIYALVAAILSLFMPSSESLWIDEGQTWFFVRQESAGDLQNAILSIRKSEAQMPAGMAYHWIAGQILGDTEWQLRAANIFWIWIAIICFYFIGNRLRIPWLPAFFAIQPFLWFYANEARPYCMQIALGAWTWLEMLRLRDRDIKSPELIRFMIPAWLLCATSMLGVIFVGAVAILVGADFFRRHQRLRYCWWGIAFGAAAFAPLAVYFAWTLMRGAGGARLWDVGILNVAFAFYEFFGFLGLGPSRVLLRELAGSGGNALLRGMLPYTPGLMALALGIASVPWFALRSTMEPNRRVTLILATLCLAITVAAMQSAATLAAFPFWGRHLAPVFPVFVTGAAILLAQAVSEKKSIAKLAVIIVTGLLITSSLRLRLASEYAKDDYRSAVALALEKLAGGSSIAWFASAETAEYYGLPSHIASTPPQIEPDSGSPPDWIFLSKPDVYDTDRTIRLRISNAGYRQAKTFSAFAVYTRP